MKYLVHIIIIVLLSFLVIYYGQLHAESDARCKRAGRYSYETYRNYPPSWQVQGFGLTTGGQSEPHVGLLANSYSYASGFNMMVK